MFPRAVVEDRARRPPCAKQSLRRPTVEGKIGTAFQIFFIEARFRQDRPDQGLVLRFTTVGGATQCQLLRGQREPFDHPIFDQGDGLERFGGRPMENDPLGISRAGRKAPLGVHDRYMNPVGRLQQPRSLDDHTAHRRTSPGSEYTAVFA